MEVELNNLPVIDWELSTRLAGNRKDLADDLLTLLIQALPDDLKLINHLHQTQNYPELLQQVHKLHGAICYCGTPRIKTILASLETDLKNNIMDSSSYLLIQLNTEVNHLLEQYSLLHK